jgi:hypothetical protein
MNVRFSSPGARATPPPCGSAGSSRPCRSSPVTASRHARTARSLTATCRSATLGCRSPPATMDRTESTWG